MDEEIFYHFLPARHAIEDLERERIKISIINALNDPFELLPSLKGKSFKARQPYHRLRRRVSSKYGLLCFSNTWQEQLLWAHYADGHKGIAIGFKSLKRKPFEVTYVSELDRVKLELTDNQKTNEDLYCSLAAKKYIGWKYENEYRILVPLEHKSCPHFLNFDGELKVEKIVLGCKFNKEDKEYMSKLALKFKAELIDTREAWEGYKINKRGKK